MSVNTGAKTLSQVDTVTPESSTFIAIASPTTGSLYKATAASVVKAGLNLGSANTLLAVNSAGTDTTWVSGPSANLSIFNSDVSVTAPSYLSHIISITSITNQKIITTLNLNNVTELSPSPNYSINVSSNATLTSVSAPYLIRTGALRFASSALSAYDFSSLLEITGSLTMTSNTSLLAYLNFPKLRSIFGALTYTGNTTFSSFPFPALTTLTGNANFSGNSLTAALVDSVLYSLGLMDGTNGKCLYGSGLTVNVGGNNAAPGTSSTLGGKTGMQWVDVLVARGATVTHN